METLIPAFVRVLRGLIDARELLILAKDLSSGQRKVSTPSFRERLSILDLTDLERQEEDIATATVIEKADLLKKAADHPAELFALEIKVLKQQYWLEVTNEEWAAQSSAQGELISLGGAECLDAQEELKHVRSPLYDENEKAALSNVQAEELRREMKRTEQRKQQQVQAHLRRAQPWVRKLWEEGHAERAWGFAAFLHPNVGVDERELDNFGSRRDGALAWARDAVGCGYAIDQNWHIQFLDWPKVAAETPSNGEDNNFQDDMSKLSERFRRARATDSNSSPDATSVGLEDDLLRNVFLLFTRPWFDAILAGYVDSMWV